MHWLRDRENQKQFDLVWDKGMNNYADYATKRHPTTYHVKMGPKYLEFGLQCVKLGLQWVKLELQCVNLVDLRFKPVDLGCFNVLTWDANISNVYNTTIV